MNLPADIYYRVVNIASSYYVLLNRLKRIEDSVMYKTAVSDGQPRGNQVSNPTERKVEKITDKQAECRRKTEAIEQSLKGLGPKYQDFIKHYFFEHKKSKDFPMSVQEKRDVVIVFLNRLARNLNEI